MLENMIALHCPCGDTYLSEPRHFGCNVKCSSCGRMLLIENPSLALPPSRRSNIKQFISSVRIRTSSTFLKKRFALLAAGILVVLVAAIVRVSSFPQVGDLQKANAEVRPLLTEPTPGPISPSPVVVPVKMSSGNLMSIEPSTLTAAPANGSYITPPQGPKGRGTLKIINNTYSDVAVKVLDNGSMKTRRFVYVHANSEAIFKNLAPEMCLLRISSGTGWDQDSRKFLYNRAFYQFDKSFDFRRVRYTVSLQPDPSGTLRDLPISEADFEEQ